MAVEYGSRTDPDLTHEKIIKYTRVRTPLCGEQDGDLPSGWEKVHHVSTKNEKNTWVTYRSLGKEDKLIFLHIN